MKYICMEQDVELFGADLWEPIACRYPQNPAKVTPGVTRAMSVLELATHHWNLRPGASKTLRKAAISAYHPFLAEMRDANPGVEIMQWAFPCYWTHHWSTLSEAQRDAIVDHWVGVLKELGIGAACANWYDAISNATPEQGDPHLAYELAIGVGKCSLARRVADAIGGPCYVALWPAQRGIGAASALRGRTLLRREILPMASTLVQCSVDGVIVWHGDTSQAGAICNPAEAAKMETKAPGAVAATREQWAPEMFGSEAPAWDLSTLPRVLHAARRERLRFADTLVAATSN